MKTINEIKKEIEELEKERKKHDNRGMFNADRDIIDGKLSPLKAQLQTSRDILDEIEKCKKKWAKINNCEEEITCKKGKCFYCDGLRLLEELKKSLGGKELK